MLLREQEAHRTTDKILGFVKADDAAVTLRSETYSHLRFAANSFLTSGRHEDVTASVTVWIDGKRGAASTNEIDDASLEQAVRQAEALARIAPVDREYLPTLGAQIYRATDRYADSTARIPPTDRARQINDAIAASEKAGVISAGFHQAEEIATAAATKNGNFDYERMSLVSLAITARTADGEGSGYFARNHFDAARLDTGRIFREAIRRALESRGARALDPGAYTVILEAQAVADLLSGGALGFDARGADEGRSPFSAPGGRTRVGEKIFDDRLSIVSDPWRPEVPGARATQTGIPAEVVYFVRNGVLERLAYTRFWAKEKTNQPTPGPVNRIVESSVPPASVEEMIRATARGLLVSRFFYIRPVDPRTATLTGLTRDGVWYVEEGEIRHPVRNFRFNQSIIQMLAPGNVEMIGAPERVSSSEGGNAILVPALKLKAFRFTSQSEAV